MLRASGSKFQLLHRNVPSCERAMLRAVSKFHRVYTQCYTQLLNLILYTSSIAHNSYEVES